ncbi:MAG: RES domain-containing protein, partial [Oligoflexia bacterium]|nr:RES domain-containing protein [Oligoflexia bacterium]
DCPRRLKQRFGVCYCGGTEDACIVETVFHGVATMADPAVVRAHLGKYGLSMLLPSRVLRLWDLRGDGCSRTGADQRLASTRGRRVTQEWSLAIHRHPPLRRRGAPSAASPSAP